MSVRIKRCFENGRQSGRTVLIPFVTAGDPDPAITVKLMHELVAAGADLIELGIPFSDPMADGPVIQAASERAIERGVSLNTVLEWVGEFRQTDADTPVVLMGYLNPFERFGYDRLAQSASSAQVDGILMVDCPPEEMGIFQDSLESEGISAIRLVAPTTSEERCRMITEKASGFIYYVSFKGTTGAGRLDADALEQPLDILRNLTDLPLAVGFGIKDGESARAVANHADGVVIGSALVEALATGTDKEAVLATASEFVRGIRTALDTPRDQA